MDVRASLTTVTLVLICFSAQAQWSCQSSWEGSDRSTRTYPGAGPTEAAAKAAAVNECFARNPPGVAIFVDCTSRPIERCSPSGDTSEDSGIAPPDVIFCSPRDSVAGPLVIGPVAQLFGEQTGVQQACVKSAAGQRIGRVYCFMYNGYSKDAPSTAEDRLKLPGCAARFFTSNACEVGYAAVHDRKSFINKADEHVVCANALAEPGTGSRGWGLVGGK